MSSSSIVIIALEHEVVTNYFLWQQFAEYFDVLSRQCQKTPKKPAFVFVLILYNKILQNMDVLLL